MTPVRAMTLDTRLTLGGPERGVVSQRRRHRLQGPLARRVLGRRPRKVHVGPVSRPLRQPRLGRICGRNQAVNLGADEEAGRRVSGRGGERR